MLRYGPLKNRRLGGKYRLYHLGDKNRRGKNIVSVVLAMEPPRLLISVFYIGSPSFILMRLSGPRSGTTAYTEYLVAPEIEPGTSGSAARNFDH
jgi:hypothetical protein